MTAGAWVDRVERIWMTRRQRGQRQAVGTYSVEVGRARLRLRIAGTGSPTIVLAPDPPNVIEHLGDLVEVLSAHHGVVCVELPGFGFSAGPDISLAGQAEILGALLDKLGLAPYALALPCGAGLVSAMVAASRPAQISHVIGVQSPGLVGMQQWAQRVDRRRLLRRDGIGQALVLTTRRRVARAWYDVAVANPARRTSFIDQANRAFDAGATFPLASALQAIEHASAPPPIVQPTLLVWGARDPTHRTTSRDELRPGAPVVTLDNAGHFPELEDVAGFCAAVVGFLRAG
jgi:pimeloyl-ACP methyl ester carboxylesterase